MMVHIRAIGMESSPSLHDYAERRAFGAIGRIASPLDRVAISISDDNGPRGGVDKRCRIVLSGSHRTIAEAVDADPYAAVDRACERLAHALRRIVERGREFLRVRHVALATRTAKPRRRGRSRAPKIDRGA